MNEWNVDQDSSISVLEASIHVLSVQSQDHDNGISKNCLRLLLLSQMMKLERKREKLIPWKLENGKIKKTYAEKRNAR